MHSLARLSRRRLPITAHRCLATHATATFNSPASSSTTPPPKPNDGPSSFIHLTDKITPGTMKAITVEPFKHKKMSVVQEQILPLLPQLADAYNDKASSDLPRDLLVKARTGTGKTLAFLVPAIESRLRSIEEFGLKAVRDNGLVNDKDIEMRARKIFAKEHVGTLIITPTRELATQIANEALMLTKHHKQFEVRLFIGGVNKKIQMRDFMRGNRDIVVATPGRLRDLMTTEPEVVRGLSKTRIVRAAIAVLMYTFR